MRFTNHHWICTILTWILLAGPLLAQENTGEESSEPVPKAQYVVALLAAMLVLVIICKPSRKS